MRLPLWAHTGIRQTQAKAIQQLTRDSNASKDARAGRNAALSQAVKETGERWVFVKISPEQWRFVMQATLHSKRPDLTFRVWNAAVTHMQMDSGEITASRQQLAKDVGTNPDEVSRAMSELAKIGAVVKHRRGQQVIYVVNSNVGWNGDEGSRQVAAKEAPKLRLVVSNPSKEDVS